MTKRNSKTVAQQCRYYEVDNIFVYMVETYINYTYFAMSFSKPVVHYGCEEKAKVSYRGGYGKFNMKENFPDIGGRKIVAYFDFDPAVSEELEVKVALSGVSTDGALKNLRAEASGYSFDRLAARAGETWNKELSVIEEIGRAHV